MSAYVVSSKQIGTILSKVRLDTGLSYLSENPVVARTQNGGIRELGADVWQMNVDAVLDRYPSDNLHSMPGCGELQYKHDAEFNVSKIVVYKLLQNLLYQCSEGDVPSRPLFVALEEIKHAWASDIIRSLPEYDAAPWGY